MIVFYRYEFADPISLGMENGAHLSAGGNPIRQASIELHSP